MSRKIFVRCLSTLLLGGACVVAGLAVSQLLNAPAKAEDKPAETKPAKSISIQGTCNFGGNNSTWSAKLTAKGDGTYDAAYLSSWNGKSLKYVGTIKTDLKTQISGNGKASGGGANGSFEFAGKFGNDGVAKCDYKEVGGSGRSGTLTAEMPK